MKLDILKGTTSRIVEVFIQDSSSSVGAGLTGVAFGDITAYYALNDAAGGATVHTPATMTIGTWASGGFIEKDATNMPGIYQLGVFNAALTGADSVVIYLKGATNMAPLVLEIQLVDYDPYAALATPTNITAAAGIAVTSIGANVITAAAIADGAIDAATFAANAITSTVIAADAITAAKVAADVHAETADAVWDEILTGATHNIATSAGRRLRGIQEFQGYEGGAVWIDTVNGATGTTDFEFGTVEQPVKTLAEAVTIATSLSLTHFHIGSGSSIQLVSNHDDEFFVGHGWTLDLNGQSVDNTGFDGCAVSGTFLGHPEFGHCGINAITGPGADMDDCHLNSTLTANASGDWNIHHCFTGVAGSGTPIFDFGTDVASSSNVIFSDYHNGIEFRNFNNQGTDLLSISGIGQVIYAASCSGTVNQRGLWKVTNTGGVTITADDINTDVMAILADTNELQADWTNGGRLDLILDIIAVDTTTDIPALIATAQADLDVITDADGVILGAAGVDLIWDEVLNVAGHNVNDSAGKRIRLLGESGGYTGGAVFIDTVNGTAGTNDFENGTEIMPVDTIADAVTIATSIGLSRFEIAPGSTIALGADFTNFVFGGHGWTLDLDGRAITGCHFIGASDVSGMATGTGVIEFHGCDMNICTLPPCHIVNGCAITGDITIGTAGSFYIHDSYSTHAGATAPVFDFGALLNASELSVRNYSGGLDLRNMGQGTGTYNATIEGRGKITLNANCTGGNLHIRGTFDIADSSSTVTVTEEARIANTKIAQTVLGEDASAFTTASTLGAIINDWENGGRLDAILDLVLADTNELQGDDVPGLIAALPTATEVVDEWETQSQADPTGFHVNLLEVAGTAQTAGDLAALITTADTAIDSVFALLNDARGEPGQGAPPVNPSHVEKTDYIYKSWRNKSDNDGSITNFYADDGTTVDHKQTTSSAAGTVTKAEIVAGP